MLGELCSSCDQKLALKGQDVPAQLRDPNNLNELLPIVDKSLERLVVQ